jgi:hypothetical protein
MQPGIRSGVLPLMTSTIPRVTAAPRLHRAIVSTSDLLTRLRIESAYVGSVARAAWLGEPVDEVAPIDVLALMSSQQKNQLAMMAANRGFDVVREELEATEELDLVPLTFRDEEGNVRVHVLLATNALYGRMASAAVASVLSDGRDIRVVGASDLALLLTVGGDVPSMLVRDALLDRGPALIDRSAFNQRLVSLGLSGMLVSE